MARWERSWVNWSVAVDKIVVADVVEVVVEVLLVVCILERVDEILRVVVSRSLTTVLIFW